MLKYIQQKIRAAASAASRLKGLFMLDTRTETFLCAARLLNYTRAAAELNITQPAVTQHIHCLEDYYGVKLFTQNGRHVSLTEAGSRLYQALTTIRNDEQGLRQELAALSRRKRPLALGATMTVGEFMLPLPLSRFLHRHPDHQIRLTVDNTANLLSRLESGALDAAIVEGYFPGENFDAIIWQREKFIPVCASGHQFSVPPATVSDLYPETLILREPGSGTREILEMYLRDRNTDIRFFARIQEISNMNAIRILTENDCGITFLYESVVRDALRRGTVRRIDLRDFDVSHNISFIWRKNSLFSDEYRTIFRELAGK